MRPISNAGGCEGNFFCEVKRLFLRILGGDILKKLKLLEKVSGI
jgi:hypothetical protein